MKYFLIILFVALSSCANPFAYKIDIHNDKFDDYTSIKMRNNFLLDGGTNTMQFNLQKITYKIDNKPNYFVHILIMAKNWMFINEGQSLTVIINEAEKIQLTGKGSATLRSASGYGITEQAYYPCTAEQVKKISTAQSVEFKLSGANFYEQRSLPIKNILHLNEFYLAHVK